MQLVGAWQCVVVLQLVVQVPVLLSVMVIQEARHGG